MSRAVCVRCGHDKSNHDVICASCGHRPSGDGLLVAWLLSRAYLSESELEAAGLRIQAGEPVRASPASLDAARKALKRHASDDTGLTRPARLGLLGLGLVVSTVPGLLLWWWWRDDRPKSAVQALVYTLPALPIVCFGVLYGWWVAR